MDGKKSIQELTVAFDQALVAAGYSESRLTNFRTVIKRLLIFGAAQGIECYSSSVGKKFLATKISRSVNLDKAFFNAS